MSRPAMTLHIVACVVLLEAVLAVQSADAYTLVDWMRSWPNYYGSSLPAAPAALPTTPPVSPLPVPAITTPPSITVPPATTPPPTVTPPPAVTTPATTCGSAVTTSSASPVYAPAAPTAARSSWCDWLFGRRTVGYRPEVRYRTRLMRVPTTNYRPIVNYDPVTGAAVTNMQPCTTYTWQFRRVPYTTYRPVYSPVTTPWSAPASPAVTGYYPGTIVPGAGTTCAAPAATPYYTPPPVSTTPLAPSTPALPPTPQPDTPADQPPSLSPTDLPRTENGQTGSSTRKYPPLEPSGESGNGSSQKEKEKSKQPAGALDLTPVPDPDAGADRKQIPAAPSLFDPNDRTANRSVRPAWSYSTIAWPDRAAGSTQQRTLSEVTEQTPSDAKEELDSSGWHAVRP